MQLCQLCGNFPVEGLFHTLHHWRVLVHLSAIVHVAKRDDCRPSAWCMPAEGVSEVVTDLIGYTQSI